MEYFETGCSDHQLKKLTPPWWVISVTLRVEHITRQWTVNRWRSVRACVCAAISMNDDGVASRTLWLRTHNIVISTPSKPPPRPFCSRQTFYPSFSWRVLALIAAEIRRGWRDLSCPQNQRCFSLVIISFSKCLFHLVFMAFWVVIMFIKKLKQCLKLIRVIVSWIDRQNLNTNLCDWNSWEITLVCQSSYILIRATWVDVSLPPTP